MKNKIKAIIGMLSHQSISESIKPKLVALDMKFQGLIPNPKLRKILYYGVGGLFGFMFLLIILGMLLSPYKNGDISNGLILPKPKIENETTVSQKELSETQKVILNMENNIRDLKFPESILTIPTVESGLHI